MSAKCKHQPQTPQKPAQSETCQECGEQFSLRVCNTCGHVGCCDSSQGHATQHFNETGHPTMTYYPEDNPGSRKWCYEDQIYLF
ncbi:MAG: UBP-type zinc finger domain-containing protein [Candidatus Marinimicrobia bacterium]|nr:UBP-type zinc finger domain-containing protein [Candidatus Neomarinimicrobiota bacterium]MCF7829415.1 UBP-type zinc finger domain-containing protein [Candidatus Neomarinimicrobiota bacterium]MCF7880901.1 UBP-type zinc finger domain-containing protein [Candidatus Neomarinimicrobiota bacterium]